MTHSNLVARATELAAARHGDQVYTVRRGRLELPYMYHLAQVVNVLTRFGIANGEVLAAAWLHDVLEDTPARKGEIAILLNGTVANIVWRVTNEGDGPEAYYEKVAGSSAARLVKLADRIANVEQAVADSESVYLSKYRHQQPFFLAACGTPMSRVEESLWGHLSRCLEGASL